MNWLVSDDPKWDPDNNITCEIDGEEVDVEECDGPVGYVPPTFTKSLERRGFTFNSNNNRWSRTWTAKTRDGEERTLEVYEKKEDGEWISLMYGNEGDIYYQNSLGYEINTES
tara:strand:+ start:256 stop:594 length:339 start_codon:yes stop_codon:yes gene_type:complete